MINLSGFTVRDNKSPNGDIEVKIVGLRPGEKLYEELLIGDDPQPTDHPKIKKINDPFIPFDKLEKDLDNLKNLLSLNKVEEVKRLLEKLLKLYKSNSKIVDHLHVESLIYDKYEQKVSFRNNSDSNKIIKLLK